jgi:hypothetical protein
MFLLNETGQSPVEVTIPVGNYTITEMELELAAQLTAESLDLFTYTVKYNTITQKITVFNNEVLTDPFAFTFGTTADTGELSPAMPLGFPVGATLTSGFQAGVDADGNRGDFVVSPNAIMLTGPNYLYVNSRKLGSLVDLYLPQGARNLGNGNAGPQIAKIPVDKQPGDVMYYKDPDTMKWFDMENLPQLTELDFYLTLGNTSQVMDFNGQPFSLKLGIIENLLTKTEISQGSGHMGHVVKRLRQF